MNTQELNERVQNELSNYDEKIIALAQYLGIDLEPNFSNVDEEASQEEREEQISEAIADVLSELDNIVDEGDNLFSYYSQEYNVCTDSEADDLWEEELNMYIDECILPEIPKHLQNYFDEEAWKSDARFDGRGHAISRYDGHENEEEVNNTIYYIYRQN